MVNGSYSDDESSSNGLSNLFGDTSFEQESDIQPISRGLVELNFYGKDLTEINAPDIIDAVDNSLDTNDIILDLSQNQLSDDGLRAIQSVLLNPRLIEIRLDNNLITGEGVQFLCAILAQRSTPLKALSISYNNIGEPGLSAIIRLLQIDYPFEALSLENCHLCAENIKLLIQNLIEHSTLKTLNLSANEVGAAYPYIATLIAQNTTLCDLNLDNCQLGSDSAYSLTDAFKINTTLCTFSILGNDNLDDKFASKFQEGLIFNISLTSYFGPDTPNNDIQKICNRNKSIPSNAPWSFLFDAQATFETKQQQLINETKPSKNASLFYASTRNALQLKQISPTSINHNGTPIPNSEVLAESIFNNAFEEACQLSIGSKK